MPKGPMGKMGSIKGVGQLIVGGEEFDGVKYCIIVSIDELGMKKQGGQITTSAQVLLDLSQVGGGVLRLEDGTEVDIVHLSTDVAESVAEISVPDPLPGF